MVRTVRQVRQVSLELTGQMVSRVFQDLVMVVIVPLVVVMPVALVALVVQAVLVLEVEPEAHRIIIKRIQVQQVLLVQVETAAAAAVVVPVAMNVLPIMVE